jgi:molybdopterin molybdotransferase
MISVEAAQGIIRDHLPAPRVERIYFQAALHRVLAESLPATMDLPPFDRAAVDGYALRSADVPVVPVDLELIGEIRAGGVPPAALRGGEAAAITTGAPVPAGADAILMMEHSHVSPDGRKVSILRPIGAGQNIVPRSFEAAAGEAALPAGRLLGPAEIAVLATFGYTEVAVFRRPRVALLATGDELIEVQEVPEHNQIRNSNAYSLTAQLKSLGIEPDYLGIAADNPDDLRVKIAAGLDHDVMIVSGGASVGPYDLVKGAFGELGIRILFDRVAVRPGKPTIFGRKDDHLIFGLPGNPVSSFVSFENFVRPALGRMCGLAHPELMRVAGELEATMRQTPGRTAFLPAIACLGAGGWNIGPLPWKGSGDILGFSRANALLIFPADRCEMARGERVEALLFSDFILRRS